MGACFFADFVPRKSKPNGFDKKMEGRTQVLTPSFTEWRDAKEAFLHARERAQWEHGHGGYSGTIAEKGEFTAVGKADSLKEARETANNLYEANDPRISNKWGPAGCIEITGENGGWIFFGLASS